MAPGVLFLCVANSARSQLAQALARARFGDAIRVMSAGTYPSRVQPMALRVLEEDKVDTSGLTSKHVDTIDPSTVDLVVTLCTEEVCPTPLRGARRLHWPIEDPAGPPDDPLLRTRFRRAKRAIRTRLDGLEAALATPPGTSLMPYVLEDRAEVEALLRAAGMSVAALESGAPGTGTAGGAGSSVGGGAGSSVGVGAGSSVGGGAGSSVGGGAGSSVGGGAGSSVGGGAGSSVGVGAGSSVGVGAGSSVGGGAGSSVGVGAGSSVGVGAGSSVGGGAGSSVGVGAGSSVGGGAGSSVGVGAGSSAAGGVVAGFPAGVVVARIGGKVVGAAGVSLHGERALLSFVVVAESHRRRRIGAALVADRLAWAQSLIDGHGQAIVASMSVIPMAGESLFTRLGFEPDAAGTLTHRFFFTNRELLANGIAAEVAAHGTMVPPFVKYPDIPCMSIGWRMGDGEWYLWMWSTWFNALDAAARAAYLAAWEPKAPEDWIGWMDDKPVDDEPVDDEHADDDDGGDGHRVD